jgi:hypothetical protein
MAPAESMRLTELQKADILLALEGKDQLHALLRAHFLAEDIDGRAERMVDVLTSAVMDDQSALGAAAQLDTAEQEIDRLADRLNKAADCLLRFWPDVKPLGIKKALDFLDPEWERNDEPG